TWWCGDEPVCGHVLANLNDLVVKPAHAGSRFEPVFGGELTAQGRDELRGRIVNRPRDYIAQERLTLSTTPALVGDRLEPRRVAGNLFWLGRYAERAEGLTRLLRGVLVRLTETSGLAESTELPVLLRAVTMMSASQPGFVGEGGEARLAAPESELLAVVYDPR